MDKHVVPEEYEEMDQTSRRVLSEEIIVRRSSLSIERIISTSFIEDDNLVNQLRECLVGCAMVDNSVRPSLLSLRNSLIPRMMQRITSFRYSLQSYNVHWTLDALEDNIGPISDIIALTKRVPSNLESLSVCESLLRPANVGAYRNVFVNAIEGELDKERGSFRASTSAYGTDDKNFEWRYGKDKAQAKNSDPTNPLFKKYPHHYMKKVGTTGNLKIYSCLLALDLILRKTTRV